MLLNGKVTLTAKDESIREKDAFAPVFCHPSSFVTKGGFFMEKIEGNNQNRLAVLAVIVEEIQAAGKVNALLSEYGEYIVGRMGLPYKEKDLSVISVVLDAPAEKINALTGKIGVIDGVSAKTLFSRF